MVKMAKEEMCFYSGYTGSSVAKSNESDYRIDAKSIFLTYKRRAQLCF